MARSLASRLVAWGLPLAAVFLMACGGIVASHEPEGVADTDTGASVTPPAVSSSAPAPPDEPPSTLPKQEEDPPSRPVTDPPSDDYCLPYAVAPLRTGIGGTIRLAVFASGSQEFRWSATAGSIVDPAAATTDYVCDTEGEQTLTLGVPGCDAVYSVTVHCG